MAGAAHAAALIDTDVLIDAARGHSDAVAFLSAQYQAAGVQISIISAMELIVGSRNKVELSETKRFLQPARIIPIDSNVSEAAYDFMESFTLSHGLMIPDALIAATASENDLTLVTKNTRHFQMITGIEVIRPY
ncbi:MAG: PIN domain-containing protein [Pyrinomonadaceae bacterium]